MKKKILKNLKLNVNNWQLNMIQKDNASYFFIK